MPQYFFSTPLAFSLSKSLSIPPFLSPNNVSLRCFHSLYHFCFSFFFSPSLFPLLSILFMTYLYPSLYAVLCVCLPSGLIFCHFLSVSLSFQYWCLSSCTLYFHILHSFFLSLLSHETSILLLIWLIDSTQCQVLIFWQFARCFGNTFRCFTAKRPRPSPPQPRMTLSRRRSWPATSPPAS